MELNKESFEIIFDKYKIQEEARKEMYQLLDELNQLKPTSSIGESTAQDGAVNASKAFAIIQKIMEIVENLCT